MATEIATTGAANSKLRGYVFTILAVSIFAVQDSVSKYLGAHYSPIFITMIRYWAFAAFVAVLSLRRAGGLAAIMKTSFPVLQPLRGVILVTEIVIYIYALANAGLALTQAIFQMAPLLVTLLSVPLLGEKVGWRRGTAVGVGLLGVLLIIKPTGSHFSGSIVFAFISTFLFANYAIATRAVGRKDSAFTSLFYSAIGGAVAISLIGPFFWAPISPADWIPVALLCVSGAFSHYCLIRAYEILEATEVQPLTYLQLVLGAIIAVVVFNETLTWNMVLGAIIVVGAGLFTVLREARLRSKNRRKPNLAGLQ